MRECLHIEKVTIVQEEKSTHHFHVWLFPWYKWMEEIGSGLDSIKKIMEYAREKLKSEDNLRKVEESAAKIRVYLNKP